MGLKEQIVFPEIDYDQVDAIRGMNITICTTARKTMKRRAARRVSTCRFETTEGSARG